MLKNWRNWDGLPVEKVKSAVQAAYSQSVDAYTKFRSGQEPIEELAAAIGDLHDSVMCQKRGTALEIAAQVATKVGTTVAFSGRFSSRVT